MSTGSPEVKVKMTVMDAEVLSKLDEFKRSFTNLNAALSIFQKGVSLTKRGIKLLMGEMAEWSKFSAAQERSIVQLNAALQATGKYVNRTAQDIARMAAEMQKTTKFGDELTIEASKWFAQMPSLDVTNMEEYMGAAQDLAEVMGVDLRVATQVLARALEDPRRASRALRRANIMLTTEQRRMLEVFDEAGMKAEAQAVIMAAVASSVGGAAQAMASTLEGTRSQIRGIEADLKEHYGFILNEFLTPVTNAWKESLESISAYMADFNNALTGNRAALDEYWNSLEDPTLEQAQGRIAALTQAMNNLQVAGYAAGSAVEFWTDAMLEGDSFMGSFAQGIIDDKTAALQALYNTMKVVTGYDPIGDFFEAGREKGAAEIEAQVLEDQRRRSIIKLEAEESQRQLRIKQEQAAILVEEERIAKEKAKAAAAQEKSDKARAERLVKGSESPEQKRLRILKEAQELQDKGLITLKEEAQIRKDLADEAVKELDVISDMEEKQRAIAEYQADADRAFKQGQKLDERIAKEMTPKDFKATIDSLTGLYDKRMASAGSRIAEDTTLAELKKQRAEAAQAEKDALIQRKAANDSLTRLIELAEEREDEARARFTS